MREARTAPARYQWSSIPPLSGGLTIGQASDNENQQFINFETRRDGYALTRAGTLIMGAPGDTGSGECVGMTYISGNDGSDITRPMLLVAKTGTTFYSLLTQNPNTPGVSLPWTSFTVPTSSLTAATYFDSMVDISGNLQILIANPNFANLAIWPGTGNASYLAASPGQPQYLQVHNNRVYMVSETQPSNIYYSDAGDPTSWPGTSVFSIDPKYGPITGLFRLDDVLYIACVDAILYMSGDPTTSLYIGEAHRGIGCTDPSTLCQLGNTIAFRSYVDYYVMSGGINNVSDAVRGFYGLTTQSTTYPASGAWACLTPYFLVTRPQNVAYLYVYERDRFGQWNQWQYSGGSAIGGNIPAHQSVVCWIPPYKAVAIPASDGNIYLQYFADEWYSPGSISTVSDWHNQPVTSTIQTRNFNLGNSSMVKELAGISIFGVGTLTSLTVTLLDADGLITTVTPGVRTSNVLPSQYMLICDGTSASQDNLFNEVIVNLSGTGLQIKDIQLLWRPVGYQWLSL